MFDTVTAGLLGSWALIGVLVGSLVCGAIGDFFGRRRLMLLGIAWFSAGTFATAFATSVPAFGALRFATGLGLGIVIASAGATLAEFAPVGRRQFYNASVYSGIPAGGVLASILGILFLDSIGWRGLFILGSLPLVILLPIAWRKLPESPRWLLSRAVNRRPSRPHNVPASRSSKSGSSSTSAPRRRNQALQPCFPASSPRQPFCWA